MRKLLNKIFIVSSIVVFITENISAQSSKKLIHDGNQKYDQKKYNEAEIDYRKSINTKDNPFIGNYNLGNAFYQQGKFDEAKQQYETASGIKSADKEQISKTFHNLGNSLVKSKKFEEGIQAYKQALKLNPKDNDTRYNLAYAQAMLQQQQQQQQQKNDKNEDKKDKDQQKQDQQKQQQQQQQQKQDQAKQDEAKKEVKKDKISKQDAEKILQALNNDEKKTQKKLNVKPTSKGQSDKEW